MTESAAASNAAAPVLSYRSSPDWHNMPEQILCPLCEYNLRGLTDPRCPECGYTFAWIDLLDPERRVHPYLFEQHGERNLWSFWKTLVGGFVPWRFWAKLKPSQPSNPRRLMIYAITVAFLSLVLGPGLAWFSESFLEWYSPPYRVFTSRFVTSSSARGFFFFWSSRYGTRLSIRIADFHVASAGALLLAAALVVLWPLATFGVLMIYRFSMRRAKVQPVHVMRCAIYSGDVALPVGLLIGAVAAFGLLRFFYFKSVDDLQWPVLLLVFFLPAWLIVFVTRLIFAYRKYLKFDHSVATVVCTQVILLMVLLLIMLIAFPY